MQISRPAIRLTVLGFALGFAASAQAQVIPGSARPDAAERQYKLEDKRPDVGGAPVINMPLQQAKKIGDGTKFELNSIVLEGSTVYGEEELKPLYADKLHTKVTLDDLNKIATDITNYYRNHGYILTRAVVPPQAAEHGVVKIRVVEGFVNSVKLQGDVGANNGHLQKYADKIKEAKPLNSEALERYLLLMEDLPGVEARAVLQPAPSATGGSDVIVTIKRKMIDFTAGLDNRGSRYLGPVQGTANFYFNDLLGLDDQTQVRIADTVFEPKELRYGEIRHEEQIGSEGTVLVVSAGTVRTKPGFTLGPLDVNGDSTTYSLGVSHPIIRSRRANWFVNSDITYRNVDVDTPGLKLYEDKTRALTLGTAYDFVDSTSAINRMEANVSHGFAINSDNNGQPHSRANADETYTKTTAKISRIQPIDGPWSVFGSVAGQYGFNALLASEEFGLGGAEFGSAYDSSEITGDSGFGTRAEIQYNKYQEGSFLSQYQLYGFYDIGAVYNRNPVPGSEVSKTSLSSTGLGMRFNLMDTWSGSIEGALPLTRPVATYGEDGHDPRLFLSLQYRY